MVTNLRYWRQNYYVDGIFYIGVFFNTFDRLTTFFIGLQNPKVVTNTIHFQYASPISIMLFDSRINFRFVIDDRLVEDC